jgi:hypothetical protein
MASTGRYRDSFTFYTENGILGPQRPTLVGFSTNYAGRMQHELKEREYSILKIYVIRKI